MIALPVSCPVLIGREAELAALVNARRELAKSRGSFVTIAGEAGIGKSRLVRQFMANSGDRRVRNLARAECAPHANGPFAPLRALIEALPAAELPHPLSERAARAVACLTSGGAMPGPHIDRGELFDGLLEMLAAFTAKRATILIIEDCHWADASTLEFLAVLAQRSEHLRLLVIITCRTEEIAADAVRLALFARIEREPSHRRITLEPLRSDQLRALLIAALDGRPVVGESTLSAIAARSEGNPFFAEELLKKSLGARQAQAAGLPVSIRGIFAERFASLDPAAQRLLSTAAVFGVRFHPHVLARVAQCSVDELVVPLKAARDAGLVVEDPGERGGLRFRHALVRDAIIEELFIFDLQRLHQRILETLERVPNPPLYALAEHAAAAGDRARTLTYGERAGEASWALGGYSEAVASFERALAAADDDVDRARIMERIAFPLSYNGDVERALRYWDTALALHIARGAYSAAARLHIIIICERFNIGDVADEGESLLAFVRDHGDALTKEQRDRIRVLIACLRSELAHVATVNDLLDRVEDESRLPPDVTQQIFLSKINRAAYDGDVAEWRTQLSGLRSLTRIHEKASVEALNVSDHLASTVLSGLYLGVNAELEAALECGRALAFEWKFDRLIKHYDAIEAAYLSTRGRFADAAARFGAPGATMHLTASLFARTAPWLQLALGDDAFSSYALDASTIESERRAVRANAQSQQSRIFVGGYALCLVRAGRFAEAASELATAFTGIERPSPRFAGLLAFALRMLPAAEIPHLTVFANANDLRADDAVGHAMADLARGALDRNPALFASAGDAFVKAGFACLAAHAFHLAGMTAQSQALYLQCGATAFVSVRAPRAIAFDKKPSLSERELAVARCVVDGLTNQAIAERLAVSKKTVEKYVAAIFRKYELRSRSQIATRLRDVLLERTSSPVSEKKR